MVSSITPTEQYFVHKHMSTHALVCACTFTANPHTYNSHNSQAKDSKPRAIVRCRDHFPDLTFENRPRMTCFVFSHTSSRRCAMLSIRCACMIIVDSVPDQKAPPSGRDRDESGPRLSPDVQDQRHARARARQGRGGQQGYYGKELKPQVRQHRQLAQHTRFPFHASCTHDSTSREGHASAIAVAVVIAITVAVRSCCCRCCGICSQVAAAAVRCDAHTALTGKSKFQMCQCQCRCRILAR